MPQKPERFIPEPSTPSRAQSPLPLIIPRQPNISSQPPAEAYAQAQEQIAYVQDLAHNIIEYSQSQRLPVAPRSTDETPDNLESVVDGLMLGYPAEQHSEVVRLGLESVPVVKKGLELARNRMPVEQQAEMKRETNRQNRQRVCNDLRNELDDLWGGRNWLPDEFSNGQPNRHQLNNLRTVTKTLVEHNIHLPTLWEVGGLLYRACQRSTDPPKYTIHAALTALAMVKEEYPSTSSSLRPNGADNEDAPDQGGKKILDGVSRFDGDKNDDAPSLPPPSPAVSPSTGRAASPDDGFKTTPETTNKKLGSPELGRRYQRDKDYDGPDSLLGDIGMESEAECADKNSRPDSSLLCYSPGNLSDLGLPIEITDSPPQTPSPSLRDRQCHALSHLQSSGRKLNDADMFDLIDLIVQVTGAHEVAIADTLWYEPDNPHGPPSQVPERLFPKTAPTLVPLHHRSPQHWTLLEADWFEDDGACILRVSHYDSLTATSRFNKIKMQATDHLAAVVGATQIKVTQMVCPQQSDDTNCGPHVLWMIYHLVSTRAVPSKLPSEELRSFLFDLLAPAVDSPMPQATPKSPIKPEHHHLSTILEEDSRTDSQKSDMVNSDGREISRRGSNDGGSLGRGSIGRGSVDGRSDHLVPPSPNADHSKSAAQEPQNRDHANVTVRKRNRETSLGDDFESQKRRMLDFIRADNRERTQLQLAIESEGRTLYWAEQQLAEAREKHRVIQAAWDTDHEQVQDVITRFQDHIKSMANLGAKLPTSGFAKAVVTPTLGVAESQLSEYLGAQKTWEQALMVPYEERVHFHEREVVEAKRKIHELEDALGRLNYPL
ncbi:unnamed protein product [Clonostachys rosea]|uniref:Ubiquitin-like protease family profile domain-containing protein n=1 Tax=Bionectria ochroleuca TaxID=29856 RepID=A0ABY6U6B3_BIOOC|nr:unnamed protein product [Clonostachys rosea]